MMQRLNHAGVIALDVFALLSLLFLFAMSAAAESTTTVLHDGGTCYVWGGASGAAQGQYVRCPPTLIVTNTTVTKTEVREVKVPVPTPGPVRIERIEVEKEKPVRE